MGIYLALLILIPSGFYIFNKFYDIIKQEKEFKSNGGNKVFKKYLEDKDFVKDLIDVIKEEGGIDNFIQKTRKLVPDKDVDGYLFMDFKGGITNPELQKLVTGKTSPIIIDKLLAKPTFRKYVQEYKMSQEWERHAADGVYIKISSENFRNDFKNMLVKNNLDVSIADKMPPREMTYDEKRKYFNLDD